MLSASTKAAELYQEYEKIWDNFPGDDFEKALELFRDYSGYNDFWAIRMGRDFAEPVSEIVADYYGEKGYLAKYRNSLLCDIRYLIFQINRTMFFCPGTEKKLNVNGHMFAVFSVIRNKTGINHLSSSPHSDYRLFNFYLDQLFHYLKFHPDCSSYEAALLQNLSWIAEGEVPLDSMLENKMLDSNAIITIIKYVTLRDDCFKIVSHCIIHLKDDSTILELFKSFLEKGALDASKAILNNCSKENFFLKLMLLNCLVDYYSMDTIPCYDQRVLPKEDDILLAVKVCLNKKNKNALLIFLDNLKIRWKLKGEIKSIFSDFLSQYKEGTDLISLLFSSLWGEDSNDVLDFLRLICPRLDQIDTGIEILVTSLEKICALKFNTLEKSKPYPVTDEKYIYFDKNDAYELLCRQSKSISNWHELETCFIERLKPDLLNTLMLAINKSSLTTITYLLSTKKINLCSRMYSCHYQETRRIQHWSNTRNSSLELSMLQAAVFLPTISSNRPIEIAKNIMTLLIRYDRGLFEIRDSNGNDIEYHIQELRKYVEDNRLEAEAEFALLDQMEELITKEKFYSKARIFFFAGNADPQSNVSQGLNRDVGTVIMDMTRKLYQLG